jgi:DNA-directed RNA polymerase specialized sigma24 family protein
LNPLSDHILVQRIKLGDRRAADQLVDAHYQRVYAILYSFCKNRETAEDLTQDTFVKMWKAIGRFNGLSRVSTWLYRIAYNTFVDWQRKQHSFGDFVSFRTLCGGMLNDLYTSTASNRDALRPKHTLYFTRNPYCDAERRSFNRYFPKDP